jgi:hypothetical protein
MVTPLPLVSDVRIEIIIDYRLSDIRPLGVGDPSGRSRAADGYLRNWDVEAMSRIDMGGHPGYRSSPALATDRRKDRKLLA